MYECAPACAEIARLSGGIGTTGSDVRVAVPIGTLGTASQVPLTDVSASTGVGEAAAGSVIDLDDIALPDTVIARPRVDLGIASASTPEAQVEDTAAADVFAGEFLGSLPTSGLPAGDYRVWAKACVADACGTRSVPVRL